MKKFVSSVYTILVIIILLCIIGLFAWRTHQSRTIRISNSEVRSNEYTGRLDESIHESRDVSEALKVAENLIAEDPLIVAIQVFSKEDGLRLSIVKPTVKDFSQVSIAESNHFDKPLTRILYHKITRPMTLNEGLGATFVSSVVTTSEIRSRLMIVLIVVIGLFLTTFILILVNPRTYKKKEQEVIESEAEYERSSDFDFPDNDETRIENSGSSDYKAPEMLETEDESYEDIDDFAPVDRLDENDLKVTNPEYGESLSMENNADLPKPNEIKSDERAGIMNRLDVELENAAASNQDLSLVIMTGDSNIDELVHEHYPDPNLIFSIDHQKTVVIETNKDLDSSIFTAKEFLQESNNQKILCGIAARNGRLISTDVLYREAASALLKGDRKSRIVGFRSDPEKYRDFIRNQKSS